MLPKNRRFKHISYGALGLLSLFIVMITDNWGVLKTVDTTLYDTWHQLAGENYTPEKTVLVPIDDTTLNLYPNEPLAFWTPQFAAALKTLNTVGAKVVGLDFLFSITHEKWMRQYGVYSDRTDQKFGIPLREQIATGKVILLASQVSDKDLLLPSTELLLAIPDFNLEAHIGLADLPADFDGVVRSFRSQIAWSHNSEEEGSPIYSFSNLMAARINNALLHHSSPALKKIRFTGPPGTFTRVPFHLLLNKNAIEHPHVQALKNKIVIIGGEYQGMNDYHHTPYSGGLLNIKDKNYMAGMELHANIVETLLHPEPMQKPGSTQLVLFRTIALSLFFLLFIVLNNTASVVTLLSSFALIPSISYFAFTQGIILESSSLSLGILTAFLGCILIKYTYEEREKKRISGAFGRYISPTVVNEIIESGISPKLGGYRQTVTILFSDIRNFTTLSERLEPEEVVDILNRYFEEISKVVLDEGGTIDKFIGDAIMVQFGAPLAFDNHADRAIRTALKVRRIATEFADWVEVNYAERNLPKFAIGVGINTGDVIVGNIGSSSHLDYTAIGDAVNTAARIESSTKSFQVIILASKATLSQCKLNVRTGEHQAVKVKGKDELVEVYEILGID